MKKIKGLLFAFVALFAFTLAMVRVNADVVLDYDAEADSNTSYAKNAELITTSNIATVHTVRSCDIAKNGVTGGKAVAQDDSGLEFTKGMMPGGNCNSVANAAFKVVSKVAGAKIGFYYTFSDKNFTSADVTKTDSLYIMDGDGNKLKTFAKVEGKNSEAYYDEYTINSASQTVYVGSDSRMITFGIVLSQGQVAQEVTVTIKDGNETIKTQSVIQNDTLVYTPAKYGFDFAGYYTDGALENAFDVSTPISEAMTLYVKWTAWNIAINQNVLDKALIDKVAVVSTDFAGGSLELTGTIYTILKASQIEASSSSIKTGGGLSPANGEKGISFVAPDDGVLTVEVQSGGDSARNAKLQTIGDEDKAVDVPVASGTAIFDQGADKEEARILTYNVESGKTYYFGGSNGLKVYSMQFAAKQPSVSLLQERVAADDVEHVRLVAVVENIEDLSDLSFVLKSSAFQNDLVLTAAAKVAKRITDHGETYSLGGVTFDVKDGVVYIKCVVEVGAKYAEASFTAEITVGGITKTVTVNALA